MASQNSSPRYVTGTNQFVKKSSPNLHNKKNMKKIQYGSGTGLQLQGNVIKKNSMAFLKSGAEGKGLHQSRSISRMKQVQNSQNYIHKNQPKPEKTLFTTSPIKLNQHIIQKLDLPTSNTNFHKVNLSSSFNVHNYSKDSQNDSITIQQTTDINDTVDYTQDKCKSNSAMIKHLIQGSRATNTIPYVNKVSHRKKSNIRPKKNNEHQEYSL